MKFFYKKFELWLLIPLFLLFFLGIIFFGNIIKYHYTGSKKYETFQKVFVFIIDLPRNLNPKNFIELIDKNLNPSKDLIVNTDSNQKTMYQNKNIEFGFKKFKSNSRNELLIIARYNAELKRSVAEIIDLKTLQVIFTYLPDIDKINSLTDTTREEFKNLLVDQSLERYRIVHPYIEDDGSLIFQSESPLVKINLCNKILWVNDDNKYHHSIEKDLNDNFIVPVHIFPFDYKKEIIGERYESFFDDGIARVSNDGKTLYEKSVAQIFEENGLRNLLFSYSRFENDPLHLNDIEEAKIDSLYWKKGDLFLSLRNISAVVHYRPETNKILKVIRGKFSLQHDIDIINDHSISIFNNNAYNTYQGNKHLGKFNEIVVYDFKNDKFYSDKREIFEKYEIKTMNGGLVEYFDDGSILTDTQDQGRIVLIDKNGLIEWEFNNIYNNNSYFISWSRLIKNQEKVIKIKNAIKNKKC